MAVTRDSAFSPRAIRLILAIAYSSAVGRLWRAEGNAESFTMWIGLLVAPMFSLTSTSGVLVMAHAVWMIVSTRVLLPLVFSTGTRERRRSTQTRG